MIVILGVITVLTAGFVGYSAASPAFTLSPVNPTYLLALADRRKGVLATFDRGLRTLAGETFDSALEIVPTR